MMREEAAERSGTHVVLEHTTVLAASCDEVWAVLADLSGWVDWNVVHPDPSRPMVRFANPDPRCGVPRNTTRETSGDGSKKNASISF